jgi:hypothetical protein
MSCLDLVNTLRITGGTGFLGELEKAAKSLRGLYENNNKDFHQEITPDDRELLLYEENSLPVYDESGSDHVHKEPKKICDKEMKNNNALKIMRQKEHDEATDKINEGNNDKDILSSFVDNLLLLKEDEDVGDDEGQGPLDEEDIGDDEYQDALIQMNSNENCIKTNININIIDNLNINDENLDHITPLVLPSTTESIVPVLGALSPRCNAICML